jgi:hypothetical protein
MARLDGREPLRLLEVAYENGPTHSEVARSYGYGAAGPVLGDFRARRRGVTVTTKLGIRLLRRTPLLTTAKATAPAIAALQPGKRRLVRRRAAAMVQGGMFDLPAARRSLAKSLRELETSRVDMLLLHDYQLEDLRRADLLRFLEDEREADSIGAYGVATGAEVVRDVVANDLAAGSVVQFRSSTGAATVGSIVLEPDQAVGTHSALGSRFRAPCGRLAGDLPRPKVGGAVGRRFLRGRSPRVRPVSIRLQCHLEQAPDPEIRITLSRERASTGMSRARTKWQVIELERRTAEVMTACAVKEVTRLGLGHLRTTACSKRRFAA